MDEPTLKGLRRWLHLASSPPQHEAPPPAGPEQGDNSVSREIEFWAYSEDCRIYGFVQLRAERLSDLLNSGVDLELSSVLLVALEDNHAVEIQRLVVQPDELVAVRGLGPRGNAARRMRRRPAPVGMRAGPYIIHGYVHTPPGADPLQAFRRRKRMVALTEGRIEYMAGSQTHRARVGTIIVNRDYVEWLDHAKDAEVRLDLPAEMRVDPRAKDMTGQIRIFRDTDADTTDEVQPPPR
jgi:hypothetical protein